MSNKAILVVGNKFQSISNGHDIISYEELIQKTWSYELTDTEVFFEQGVSEESVDEYKNSILRLGTRKPSRVYSYFDEYTRCDKKLTHKRLAYNALISDPQALSEKKYSSVLMIDERCAEVSDHVTGKHIQLMVLVEAARQMVLAVTEKFFIPEAIRHEMSFVAEEVDTQFKQFALPFSTTLIYEIENQRILPGNNIVNNVKISFIQNDLTMAEVTLKSKVFSKQFLIEKEDDFVNAYLHSKKIEQGNGEIIYLKKAANYA